MLRIYTSLYTRHYLTTVWPLLQPLGLHTQHVEEEPRVLVDHAAEADVGLIVENDRSAHTDLDISGLVDTEQLQGPLCFHIFYSYLAEWFEWMYFSVQQ